MFSAICHHRPISLSGFQKARYSNQSTKKVTIFDSTARDGIQGLPKFIPTPQKIKLVQLLADSKIPHLEIASVTKLPQMADGEAVCQGFLNAASRYWALVLNPKGVETAKAWGVTHIGLASTASDAFSQKNINRSADEAFEKWHMPVMQEAIKVNMVVRAYLSAVFGFYEPDDLPYERTVELSNRFLAMGAAYLVPSDTVAFARPEKVKQLCKLYYKKGISPERLALHFHGEKSLVLENIQAGLEEGVRIFDTSLKGLGGCPAAQMVHGADLNNAPTLEVVEWLQERGFETGIDLVNLMRAQEFANKMLCDSDNDL